MTPPSEHSLANVSIVGQGDGHVLGKVGLRLTLSTLKEQEGNASFPPVNNKGEWHPPLGEEQVFYRRCVQAWVVFGDTWVSCYQRIGNALGWCWEMQVDLESKIFPGSSPVLCGSNAL